MSIEEPSIAASTSKLRTVNKKNLHSTYKKAVGTRLWNALEDRCMLGKGQVGQHAAATNEQALAREAHGRKKWNILAGTCGTSCWSPILELGVC